MKVTMLLADAAQVVDNKLYILGGGWSVTGPDPTPHAIAIKLEVPWDMTGRAHDWDLVLLDQDGNSILVESGNGPVPVQITSRFEVARPDNVPPGVPVDIALAVNVGPLPLPPAGRYEWRLSIDGSSQDEWAAAFSTRPPPEGV